MSDGLLLEQPSFTRFTATPDSPLFTFPELPSEHLGPSGPFVCIPEKQHGGSQGFVNLSAGRVPPRPERIDPDMAGSQQRAYKGCFPAEASGSRAGHPFLSFSFSLFFHGVQSWHIVRVILCSFQLVCSFYKISPV